MNAWRAMAVLAGVLAVSGCFKLDLNLGGSKGGGDKGGEARPPDGGAPSDPGEAAPTQLPASDPGGGSWHELARDIAGSIFLDADHGAVFHAFDTLAYPRTSVDLVARVTSARDLQPLAGVTVAFSRGEWVAGRTRTNADGYARLPWTPPAAGNYTFTAKIVDVPGEAYQELLQVSPGDLLVAARTKDTPFVVIDLDHTVVDSSFLRALVLGGKPMADSVAVTKRIAQAYSIIYLTHRPDLLTRKSKLWLKRHGYPPGPLLVSEMKDVFDSGTFKTAKLSAVRKAFPKVAVGIGDKASDAQAYVDNGLAAYLIPDYEPKSKDMRKAAGEIRALRGRGRLHVVSGWRQIEASLFDARSYPAADFARDLDRRADRLDAERRARKTRDDDDDD
jgi:hypothetical protein